MRFPRLILEEIRRRVGDRMAVLCRINAADEEPGGIDVNDACVIARYLEECGADALHISRAVHCEMSLCGLPPRCTLDLTLIWWRRSKSALASRLFPWGVLPIRICRAFDRTGKVRSCGVRPSGLADPEMPRKIRRKVAKRTRCRASLAFRDALPICMRASPYVVW